jgi:malonyl-CoA decarboxylase
MRLCARYLTRRPSIRIDPVAHFHLGNGARLERINWLGNSTPRGIRESFGMMVNYLYDRDTIEDNREAFVRGTIVCSPEVDAISEELGGAHEVDARPRSVKRRRADDIATSTADAVRLDPHHPNNIPTPDERG